MLKKRPITAFSIWRPMPRADSVRNSAGVEFFERRAFLSDIYALPLHADLICLSACQSGLGEWRDGEGVMSLARAFAYAGSKGLVATLWSVNEASSSVLFQSFYTHLRQGMSKAAALNQAKQDYLNNPAIPVFQKTPYYWAALTYIGEDSVVRMEEHAVIIWILGGIGALSCGLRAVFFTRKRSANRFSLFLKIPSRSPSTLPVDRRAPNDPRQEWCAKHCAETIPESAGCLRPSRTPIFHPE